MSKGVLTKLISVENWFVSVFYLKNKLQLQLDDLVKVL